MENIQGNRKVFALVVLFGFETKNFFESGMYSKLSKTHDILILKRKFTSKNFEEYIARYNLTVIELTGDDIRRRTKLEDFYLASRRARNRLLNIENFNYFSTDRKYKASDRLIGSALVHAVLGVCTRYVVSRTYVSRNIQSILRSYSITDVVIAGYSSPIAITISNTALKLKKNVHLIINSWKDFYVNDFIPFTPSTLLVWSEYMKKQILANNGQIDKNKIVISGNPSFDRFFSYQPVNEKIYYAQKYNFDVERPLILYSMISPIAYAEEKKIIELINRKIVAHFPNKSCRPVIILRKNPLDDSSEINKFFSNDNVRYADNYFEGSYEYAVFVQLVEGETEWLDLLYHSDVNINIASTVTLESLMMKTPVINVEFDSSGRQSDELSRYSEAPFYLPLKNRNDVIIATTIDECISALTNFLANKDFDFQLSPIIDDFDGKAVKRIINNIEPAQ